MRNLTKFYIGGQWVEPLSSATLPVLNPATEAQIGAVAMGTRDAAETVKRVTLELGGKSPNLVFADCDLEARVSPHACAPGRSISTGVASTMAHPSVATSNPATDAKGG